eukprot:202722-Chlamydomonas_euryale.AAC.4
MAKKEGGRKDGHQAPVSRLKNEHNCCQSRAASSHTRVQRATRQEQRQGTSSHARAQRAASCQPRCGA